MMKKIKSLFTFSLSGKDFSVKKLKKRIYISLAVFFGITLLFLIFVVPPLFRDIKRESGELTLLRTQEIKILKMRKNIGKMKSVLSEHKEGFEEIEALFVDLENPLPFINFLEGGASKSGIYLEITSLRPERKEAPWSSFSFQVEIAGPFENFLRFLEKLESGPYLIQIVNLNLKRLEKRDLREEEFKEFSVGDVQGLIKIKAFRK